METGGYLSKLLGGMLRLLDQGVYPRLCPCCRGRMQWMEHAICPHCAIALRPYESAFDHAEDRLFGSPLFRRLYALYGYEKGNMVQHLMHAFKYHGFGALAEFFVEEIGRRDDLLTNSYDLVLAVPSNRTRVRKRGYNPSLLIAEALGLRLQIPATDHLVIRDKGFESQTTLDKSARMQNVRSAYHLNEDLAKQLSPRRILLVDDVLTTGSTLMAVCDALEKMPSIESVDVFAVSVTIYHK